MSTTGADVRERIEALLNAYPGAKAPLQEVEDALTDGYGYALTLDSQRLRIERRINELVGTAEEPGAADELRRLWLRHRTIDAELTDLRALLRELRETSFERRAS